ncbi:MAG: T9SS type A sorting domain-containing protein [Saprospiraceae bacterium]|nr:T9SS type A sorting domain-containing protein [Saprospiraceae bacterium]
MTSGGGGSVTASFSGNPSCVYSVTFSCPTCTPTTLSCTGVSNATSCTVSFISLGSGSNSISAAFTRTAGSNVQCPATGSAGPITVLPIELKSFEIKNNANAVNMLWVTASETNNDFFTLQRSADAVHFENIAIIEGAGNSSTEIYYSFTDVSPLRGTNYYRIKQTDFDGKFSYSDVRSVSMVTAEKSQLNTFITDNILVVNTPLEDYDVIIYNSWGTEVKRYHNLQNYSTIDVQDLKSGALIIRISYDGGSETHRVVKL